MAASTQRLALNLQGLESLFDPHLTTKFLATQSVFTPSKAKVDFVVREMHKWASFLETNSGAHVLNVVFIPPMGEIGIKPSHGNFSYSRPQPWNNKCIGHIELAMEIAGGISTAKISDGLGKALSGQVKKQLALDLLARFPPPFNTGDPLMMTGSYDYFQIAGRTIYCAGNADQTALRDKIIAEIGKLIKAAGAEIVETTCTNWFTGYDLTIKWLKDIDNKSREQLREEISQLFQETLSYKPEVYLWVW